MSTPPPSSPKAAPLREMNHALIATHVVLIGLTPFIPVPFVDDYLKDQVQRRLVRHLALANDVTLAAADVPILADDRRRWARSAARYALYPMKKIFKKTFLVLGVKGSIDVVSIAWHRAFLLDHAFASGWSPRAGGRTAAEVRAAVDAVCEEIPVKPVAPALEAAFAGSRVAIHSARVAFDRIFRGGAIEIEPEIVSDSVERAAEEPELASLSARVRQRLAEVPEAHLNRLRAALAERLAEPVK